MEDDYDSDYAARPEAGRPKRRSLDSDESDNDQMSGLKGRLQSPVDDDDDSPVDSEGPKPEVPPSTTLIRQSSTFTSPHPSSSTVFIPAPDAIPRPASEYNNVVSADGTSVFCVEGYVNTPELSAAHTGGLDQGLPTTGPYRSLFRAGSEARSSTSGTPRSSDANLHVLADAAQSPRSTPPVTSPASASTPKRRRKPSPLAAPSPTPSVAVTSSIPAAAPPRESWGEATSSPVAGRSQQRPPPPAKPRSGANKGKAKPKASPVQTPRPISSHADAGARQYEQPQSAYPHSASSQASSAPSTSGSTIPSRPQSQQKSRVKVNDAADFHPPPPAPAVPSESTSHDYADDYYASYSEGGLPSATEQSQKRTQESTPPPPRIWEPPLSSSSVATSGRAPSSATRKASPTPSSAGSRRSQSSSTKLRMITLLIEDRRTQTDELAEVRVPLKTAGEGFFWADASDVCGALQSGPSRIDGPAKVLTMRGKYRQTLMRISAEGTETSQSANLKVDSDRTVTIVVESIVDFAASAMQTPLLNAEAGTLLSSVPLAPVPSSMQPLTPMSNALGLESTPVSQADHEPDRRADGGRKRKRETNATHANQARYDPSEIPSPSSEASASVRHASMPYDYPARPKKLKRNDSAIPLDREYASGSSSAHRSQALSQRRPQDTEASRSQHSDYGMDPPSSPAPLQSSRKAPRTQDQHARSDRRPHALLKLSPAPAEDAQSTHTRIVSFLRKEFMHDEATWDNFVENRAHPMLLSNEVLLRVYWFAQKRLDEWVDARAPEHLGSKPVTINHVLSALGVTEDWYRDCNETLSLLIAYGERGERYEDARAVAASRDRASKTRARGSGPTDLLKLLRRVHDEYCVGVRGDGGSGA